MEKKCDLGDLSYTLLDKLMMWDVHIQQSRVYTEWCNKQKNILCADGLQGDAIC